MKKCKTEVLILSTILFLFNGCLKDFVTQPVDINFDNSAEILDYLESEGDYINSDNFPSLVTAQEVYNNITSYLIIDVRPHDDYLSGHIQNSINIKNDTLLNFIKSKDLSKYPKTIIVSETGQAASYYAGLLILDGYSNVYAMKYGMASWNNDFASPWLHALKNLNARSITHENYPMEKLSNLPNVTLPENGSTIKAKVEERIGSLLKEGFEDDFQLSYSTPAAEFDDVTGSMDPNIYFICLGDLFFYGTYTGLGHPRYAVNYIYMQPNFDLESANYLQTIPGDRIIYLYSYAGHISAFITAYLRVLGYNANSILFGGNNIIYSMMLNSQRYNDYTFTSSDINSFPYLKGNAP